MTKRDKIIIMFLAVIVLAGATYYFGVVVLGDMTDRLNMEVNSAQRINDQHISDFERLQDINAQIPVFEGVLSQIISEYTRDLNQEEYILLLQSFLTESNIVLNSFSHSFDIPLSNSFRELEELAYLQREDDEDNRYEEEHVIVAHNSYRLDFNSTHDELLTFLRLLEDSGSGFTSSSVNISTVLNSDILNISMELRFHYIINSDELATQVDFANILEAGETGVRSSAFSRPQILDREGE
ncbi:MAG: hypothetical protein FWD82_06615 [Defluviitaleaceae bacterium]|nr:hypothetical protein [Defluviitaleaceae bacterium]